MRRSSRSLSVYVYFLSLFLLLLALLQRRRLRRLFRLLVLLPSPPFLLLVLFIIFSSTPMLIQPFYSSFSSETGSARVSSPKSWPSRSTRSGSLVSDSIRTTSRTSSPRSILVPHLEANLFLVQGAYLHCLRKASPHQLLPEERAGRGQDRERQGWDMLLFYVLLRKRLG
jgi:hypothetical protein